MVWLIIGITGYIGAGKDIVVNYLVKQGFTHISLSDILRRDLTVVGEEITRGSLQEIGRRMRKEYGSGVLAKRALAETIGEKNCVISGIGTVAEVNVLRQQEDFHLWFINAPLKTRYARVKLRAREGEAHTFAHFKKTEEKEKKGGGKGYREFEKTKKVAESIINNNSSITALYTKVEAALHKIRNTRGNWNNYFLGIMQAVRERGTCDRGRTGCVVVKDNRILTTGYVGSPSRLPHCSEVGHLIQEVVKDNGSISKHCIRTIHAEQNAICQAARAGIALEGATMYCYLEPCFTCAKMIINTGIQKVIAQKAYHSSQHSREAFKQAGIKLIILDKTIESYPTKN